MAAAIAKQTEPGTLWPMRRLETFAIDIDGVLADIETMLNDLAIHYTGQPWPCDVPSTPNEPVRMIDEAVLQRMFDEFHEQRISRLTVLPGAREALEQLQYRYRLVILTARRPTCEALTRAWLEEQRLPFHALYHLEDKSQVPEPVTVAIDDHPRHVVRYLAVGIRCLVMDYPRNRQLEPHPQLTRVQSWHEVLTQLSA